MLAITGITGQVGGATAEALLAQGKPVRAVVRSAEKGAKWAERGCELALADMTDARALAQAFRGCEAVFVLIPPTFDPSYGFPETRAVINALIEALLEARPERVVCLSTIGAQASEQNLLNQLGLVEQSLKSLPMPVTFLRAAWFFENALWDVDSARQGVIYSHLQPLERQIPMVATADIGELAAQLLQEQHEGVRVVELESAMTSPQEMAQAFASVLGHEVEVKAVPRGQWETDFAAFGMKNPGFRAQMLDGFNAGWIRFEGTPRRGRHTALDVVRALTQK